MEKKTIAAVQQMTPKERLFAGRIKDSVQPVIQIPEIRTTLMYCHLSATFNVFTSHKASSASAITAKRIPSLLRDKFIGLFR